MGLVRASDAWTCAHADEQEAGAAAQATISMLRAELADSHRAESAAQEVIFQASSDVSESQVSVHTLHDCASVYAASLARKEDPSAAFIVCVSHVCGIHVGAAQTLQCFLPQQT